MTTTITPVAQYTTTALTRPQDGEDAYMDGGPAPLAALFQAAFDRSYALWQQGHAVMPWRGDIEVTATDIIVPPLAVMLLSGSTWKHWPTVGATLALPSVTDAWRYAYLYLNSGVLDVEFSTTAPDSARVWKTGAFGTHRYLCSVRFGGSGALPYLMVRGRVLYRRGAISGVTNDFASGGLRALEATTAVGSYTDLDLSARVPSHARVAILRVEVFTTGGADVTLSLNTDPDTGAAFEITARADSYNTATVEMPVSAAQVIQYKVASASGAPLVHIDVLGWLE